MASLKKTKIVDPSGRVNLSLKRSTRIALEQYRHFCEKAHKVEYERSELVEQVIVAWLEQDGEFTAFVSALTARQKADIESSVEKSDTPAPATARTVTPAAPIAAHSPLASSVQMQTRPAYGATSSV
jgi:uncharacterized protein (UPF0335 family)